MLFLVGHLGFLPPTPDDIDAVNFTLALDDFDIERHQPHPPGYPIFVAMGRLSHAFFNEFLPGSTPDRPSAQAAALAVWSALFGAVAVWPLLQLFACLELNWRRSWAAVLIVVASPLFWFTSVRPLSSVPGLTVSLIVQALALTAFRRQLTAFGTDAAALAPNRDAKPEVNGLKRSDRLLMWAGFMAGVAGGIRSQTIWLTIPLLVVVLCHRTRRKAAHVWFWSGLAFIVGVALWASPLVIASGGLESYLRIFAVQAEDDLAGAGMLLLHATPRNVARALYHTFVLPWGDVRLAVPVLAAALLGAVTLLRRSRTALMLLGVAAIPYATFHLLIHETAHTRYALPLIPVIGYLAATGFDAIGRRAMAGLTLAVVAASLYLTVPLVVRYGRVESPVFHAAREVRAEAAKMRSAPVLAMHNGIWMALRGEQMPLTALPSPPGYEWLELTKYWREGGTAPVWFLARPRRTDLALIDPASRRLRRRYQWPFRAEALLGGVRPNRVDWYEIGEPGWFAERGWSLTPEVGGISHRDRSGPAHAPIVAFVRRRQAAVTLIVGGRSQECPEARLEAAIDGRPFLNWSVPPGELFLQMYDFPAGSLAGRDRYARIEIAAVAVGGDNGRLPSIAIDQFDVQPEGRAIFGFDDGWHASEYAPRTGQLWRWTDAVARLRVHSSGRSESLRLRGESPLEYFSRPPRVTIRAGAVLLHTFSPSHDFDLVIPLPVEALDQADGVLTIETTETFVPDDTEHNGDRRRLGLRVFDIRVEPRD